MLKVIVKLVIASPHSVALLTCCSVCYFRLHASMSLGSVARCFMAPPKLECGNFMPTMLSRSLTTPPCSPDPYTAALTAAACSRVSVICAACTGRF